MEVAARTAEEHAAYRGEHWVADVTMQWWHRARLDAAEEPVAHHKFVALPELLDEAAQIREVVAVVGVTHDDVTPARRGDSRQQRAAIAARSHSDNTRAVLLGDIPRAVGAAIVGNHDFTHDPGADQERTSLCDARGKR